MHRTNIRKVPVSKRRSSQRSHENNFEKEDSPNLPVPPRRKTNTLSMLRKIFDEYDEMELRDTIHSKQLSRSSSRIQQDVNETVPDHCWVGEYLDDDDDEDVDETPAYPSHISAALQSLRGKPQNLPSSSGSTLASFGVTHEMLSSRRDADPYQAKFDDVTDREIKELQRKEREKEEQLYKIMLESLEYKTELERLKREASLKRKNDAAKVFDYGHGTSDQSRANHMQISSSERTSTGRHQIDPYMNREYELPRSSHQQGANVVLQGRNSSVFDPFRSEHDSDSSRKIVDSNKSGMAFISPNIQQKNEVNTLEHGYYGDHSTMIDKPERTLRRFRDRDMINEGTNNVGQEYQSSSGAMSSFGSAFSHITKTTKKDTPQSYEDYLDELQLKLQEEETAACSDRKESLHGKMDKGPAVVNEGLPISVLTSVGRIGSRNNEHRNTTKGPSTGTPPPLKIKPALKNFHKDAFKKGIPGSGRLIESLEEMSSSSRLNMGNFNDTRTVLMEDSQLYARDDDFSKLGYGGRVVVGRDTHQATSLNNKTYSQNIRSSDGSWKLINREDQNVESKSRSNKSHPFDVNETMNRGYNDDDDDDDDVESGPFLHRSRSIDSVNVPDKTSPMEKDSYRKRTESKSSRASSSTSRSRVTLSRGHSSRGRPNQTVDDQQLIGNSIKTPNHLTPSLHLKRKANKRSLSPSPSQYYDKSSKYSDRRIQGFSGDEMNRMDVHYRKSSSKLTSCERSDRASSKSKRHRNEDRASKSNNEYIDQFFDRQIKIWSKSSEKVPEAAERLVERQLQKSRLSWEEEVDRYVNMSASIDTARDDRHEKIPLNEQRGREGRRGRRIKRSHIDVPIASWRDGKSHSPTPSTNRRMKDGRSSLDRGTRNQNKSGKDERRFENRSPLLKVDQSIPLTITSESDFRRVKNLKQKQKSSSNEKPLESHRGNRKRIEPSPAPVPLMPSGWCPAKIRKLPNSIKRSTSYVKKLDRQLKKRNIRNVVRKETQQECGRNVVRKRNEADRRQRAPPSDDISKVDKNSPSSVSNQTYLTDLNEAEISKSNEELSVSRQDQLKTFEPSPSPVPLMPSGWSPANMRNFTTNASSVKELDQKAQNETTRNVVKKETQNDHGMNVASKGSASVSKRKVPLSKSVKILSTSKGELEVASGCVRGAARKSSSIGNFERSVERVISKIPNPSIEETQSSTDLPKVLEKRNSSEVSKKTYMSLENAKNALHTCDESLESKTDCHENKSPIQQPIVVEDKSGTSQPKSALSGDVKPGDTLLTKDSTEHAGTDNTTVVQSKPKTPELLVSDKKTVALPAKGKIVNIQKSSVSVGKGQKILMNMTGAKRIQKTPLERQLANSKPGQKLQIKPKLLMKKKPPLNVPGKSKESNLAKPIKPPVGRVGATSSSSVKITEDGTSSSAATKFIVVDDDEDWMRKYQNWFIKFLQSTLSNNEIGKKLGWDNPVNFLNCVTTGNKRAMSYIPRGARAKELLRFIALNKKTTSASPEVTSKDVKASVDVKLGCSIVEEDGAHGSNIPSTGIEHQKNEVADAQETTPCNKHATKDGEGKNASGEKNLSRATLGPMKNVKKRNNIPLKDTKQLGNNIVKQNITKPNTVKGMSNVGKQLKDTKKQPEITQTPKVDVACVSTSLSKQSLPDEKEPNLSHEHQRKSMHSDSVLTVESKSTHGLSNETLKEVPSQQSKVANKAECQIQQSDEINKKRILQSDDPEESIPDTAQNDKLVENNETLSAINRNFKKNTQQQPRKNKTMEIAKISPMINKRVKQPSKSPKQQNPETAREDKLVDIDKKQSSPAPDLKITKKQPKIVESTDTTRIVPVANVKSEHDNRHKKVSIDTTSCDVRESRLENRYRRESYDEELIIPTEEPILNAAQKGLLPAFKKCVQRTTSRTLNILYEFDNYDKRKLRKAARDILDAFSLSKQRKHGFTNRHALYYMASLFKNPPADSLDDVQRHLRKSNLDGPQFEFSLQTFLNFKNVVVSLCKSNLDPNKSLTSQSEIQKNFVRQRSEYLFPQFSYEADSIMKLWIWSERMQYVLRKESSSRPHVKLDPFPDDCGQTMEDRIATWMKRILRRSIYNETDNFGHGVICAVKTELMKRKSHATRQEAMNLVMRSSIKESFRAMEMIRKSQEKTPDPSVDLESSELIVLDEVYSDESEDENVLDMVHDSESIQIDDSESVHIDLF